MQSSIENAAMGLPEWTSAIAGAGLLNLAVKSKRKRIHFDTASSYSVTQTVNRLSKDPCKALSTRLAARTQHRCNHVFWSTHDTTRMHLPAAYRSIKFFSKHSYEEWVTGVSPEEEGCTSRHIKAQHKSIHPSSRTRARQRKYYRHERFGQSEHADERPNKQPNERTT